MQVGILAYQLPGKILDGEIEMKKRLKGFDAVETGLTREMALAEGRRCDLER